MAPARRPFSGQLAAVDVHPERRRLARDAAVLRAHAEADAVRLGAARRGVREYERRQRRDGDGSGQQDRAAPSHGPTSPPPRPSPAYGLTNLSVMRSLSPMRAYFSWSTSFSANVGGSDQTPLG